MEPLDPAQNDDTGGFLRRRLSSILKAPRKSLKLSEHEQVENPMETVEKRNSRRVSFALTNDVLVFSKDVQKVSAAQSSSPDLTPATVTAESGVQMSLTEDGIQQVNVSPVDVGMDTLSRTSLQTTYKRQEVTFADAPGEKTVVFANNDAFMDLTLSHTVNIGCDPNLHGNGLRHKGDVHPAYGEKTVVFSEDVASMEMTQSQTVNLVMHGLVAGPSKPNVTVPSKTSVDPFFPDRPLQLRTQMIDGDKENQAPASRPVVGFSVDRMRRSVGLSSRSTTCPDDEDISMDMTEAHTANIVGFTPASAETQNGGSPEPSSSMKGLDPGFSGFLSSLFKPNVSSERSGTSQVELGAAPSKKNLSPMDLFQHDLGESSQTGNSLSCAPERSMNKEQSSDALASANHKGVETVMSNVQSRRLVKFDHASDGRENTVVFAADEAFMDMTQSHTVNIAPAAESQPLSHHSDFFPAHGEKTVMFTVADAHMDMTQSHTVKITATNPVPQSETPRQIPNTPSVTGHPDSKARRRITMARVLPKNRSSFADLGFKNIIAGLSRPSGATITTPVHPTTSEVHMGDTEDDDRPLNQNMSSTELRDGGIPTYGEKTVTFTTNDASMDITHCHTVHITTDSVPPSLPAQQNAEVLPTCGNGDLAEGAKRRKSVTNVWLKHSLLLAPSMDLGGESAAASFSTSNGLSTPSTVEAAVEPSQGTETNVSQADVVHHARDPRFLSEVTEKLLSEANASTDPDAGAGDDISMEMTAAQTGRIVTELDSDQPPMDVHGGDGLCHHQDNFETTTGSHEVSTDPVLLDEHGPVQRSESSPDGDKLPAEARRSRRLSLADLQTKAKRLSHIWSEATESATVETCSAALPTGEQDLDQEPDAVAHPPATEPQPGPSSADPEDETLPEPFPQTESATPFNSKTSKLMSRLSMGGFLPKLPQRGKHTQQSPAQPSVPEPVRENVRNNSITLGAAKEELCNIDDEVLGCDEDLSEVLDMREAREMYEEEEENPFPELAVEQELEDCVFEETPLAVGMPRKRPQSEVHNRSEDEKRRRPSDEAVPQDGDGALQQWHVTDRTSHTAAAPSVTTDSIDSSSSCHSASIRCETASESVLKQSLLESQLEDSSSVVQKLNDGTITVFEFLKLFSLDFVIHNSRQSVLPGKLGSPMQRTQLDAMRDRHINYPKKLVYEADLRELTEKVDGLKGRQRDLDKPLKSLNRRLWEDLRGSSESELKGFGAKLKEWNNFFRNAGKVQSHEMKEVLHSNLRQANLDEQQKLRGKLEMADEMLSCLDDCISGLEAELAVVEEKGEGDTPSLQAQQKEMERVTKALADVEREISALEAQKKADLDKCEKLEAERETLGSHLSVLNMLNEWKLVARRDDCAVYAFLYGTLQLLVEFETSDGKDASGSERKISQISFKFQLNDEKSQCHARLVHKLLSQHFEGAASWVEKYPTAALIPKLLQDVGLVVSRCRLLGEELRVLKTWGGLRLNILHISCVDTQVHIAFSSLKTLTKFEVTFAVSLIHQICVLRLHSFRNVIGDTTIQQIEEILASFIPGKNLLTKTVKRISEMLLC